MDLAGEFAKDQEFQFEDGLTFDDDDDVFDFGNDFAFENSSDAFAIPALRLETLPEIPESLIGRSRSKKKTQKKRRHSWDGAQMDGLTALHYSHADVVFSTRTNPAAAATVNFDVTWQRCREDDVAAILTLSKEGVALRPRDAPPAGSPSRVLLPWAVEFEAIAVPGDLSDEVVLLNPNLDPELAVVRARELFLYTFSTFHAKYSHNWVSIPSRPANSTPVKAPLSPNSPAGTSAADANGTAQPVDASGAPPPPPAPPLNVPPAPPPGAPGPPPLPSARGPAPPSAKPGFREANKAKAKVAMKQVYWSKLPPTKAEATIFVNVNDTEVDLDKEQLEQLFSAKAAVVKIADESTQRTESKHLLESQRAQSIGILLSRLHQTPTQIRETIMALSLENSPLLVDNIRALMRYLPTPQETALLQSYTGEREDLGVSEQFLLEMSSIPRLKQRLQAFLFKLESEQLLSDLKRNIDVLSQASTELLENPCIVRLFEIILALGNFLNSTSSRGEALGFRLDALTKLSDTKTVDNKSTLLHYLVSFVESRYPDLLTFTAELPNLENAGKASDTSQDELALLKRQIQMVAEELVHDYYTQNADTDCFFAEMSFFHDEVVKIMSDLEAECTEALSLFDRVCSRFGEDPTVCTPSDLFGTMFKFKEAFRQAYLENQRLRDLQEMERKVRQKKEFLRQRRASVASLTPRSGRLETSTDGHQFTPRDRRMSMMPLRAKDSNTTLSESREGRGAKEPPAFSFTRSTEEIGKPTLANRIDDFASNRKAAFGKSPVSRSNSSLR